MAAYDPPPHSVALAAQTVDQWLKSREPAGRVSDAEFAKMSARERIDYARQFDQSQFQKNDAPR
jgi:hypothetical protein